MDFGVIKKLPKVATANLPSPQKNKTKKIQKPSKNPNPNQTKPQLLSMYS